MPKVHALAVESLIVGKPYTNVRDAYEWGGCWPVVNARTGIVSEIYDGTAPQTPWGEDWIFADYVAGQWVERTEDQGGDAILTEG